MEVFFMARALEISPETMKVVETIQDFCRLACDIKKKGYGEKGYHPTNLVQDVLGTTKELIQNIQNTITDLQSNTSISPQVHAHLNHACSSLKEINASIIKDRNEYFHEVLNTVMHSLDRAVEHTHE